MCSLLWTLYLKQDLEKIAKFFNKSVKVQHPYQDGYYPRHIFDDLSHSDAKLSSYLYFCLQFFDTFFQVYFLLFYYIVFLTLSLNRLQKRSQTQTRIMK